MKQFSYFILLLFRGFLSCCVAFSAVSRKDVSRETIFFFFFSAPPISCVVLVMVPCIGWKLPHVYFNFRARLAFCIGQEYIHMYIYYFIFFVVYVFFFCLFVLLNSSPSVSGKDAFRYRRKKYLPEFFICVNTHIV